MIINFMGIASISSGRNFQCIDGRLPSDFNESGCPYLSRGMMTIKLKLEDLDILVINPPSKVRPSFA